MKVAVLNASPTAYNLAVEKIANSHKRRGDSVVRHLDLFNMKIDKVYISAIFTWDLPKLVKLCNRAKLIDAEIELGGPAVTKMQGWVYERTGIAPFVGLDDRFDKEPGEYEYTFTSRGCPRNCPFCLVSDLEGKNVVSDPYFLPAPNIGDNNILMTSEKHQAKVVLVERRFAKVDLNSGFDCRVFQADPEHYYLLWRKLPLKAWRFAFDDAGSEEAIIKVMEFFKSKGLDRHMVQVYVLCNFPGTSSDEVRERAEIIKGYGMQPYLMSYIPVTSVNHSYLAPEWDRKELARMIAYYNQPKIWMSCTFDEFRKEANEHNGLFETLCWPV